MFLKVFFLISSYFFSSSIISSDVTTVFTHGAYAHPGQAKRFHPAFSNVNNVTAVKFSDSQSETSWNPLNRALSFIIKKKLNVDFAPSKAHFGYGKDIDAIQETMENKVSGPAVLYGCCRGSVASMNYLAKAGDDPKVKAMVAEATPVNVSENYNNLFANYGIPTSVSERLFKTIWSAYPSDSKTTLQAVRDIKNKELPILLLHSKEDRTFPFFNALQLYSEFKKQGFSNVYIAPLKGAHAWALRDDKENYLKAVHSFYKHHGLPYNEKYGTEDMKNYSYDFDKAQQVIKKSKQNLQNKIQNEQQKMFPWGISFMERGPF